jgi:Tfp pilus assembly protein PilO
MKSSDRMVVVGIGVLGLLAALWFLAISPKRAEVATLDDEISTVEAAISEQEQLISAGTEAKKSYGKDYQELVVLGKAVPADDDAASLIDQTQTIADRAGVDFRSITLGASSGEAAESTAVAPAAPATPAPADAVTEGVPAAADAAAAAAAATPVAPTEAAAALLPIGATVGPAGLPVMPYELTFRGDFFEVADFIAGIDSMVRTKSKGVGVDGRLLTVDGFTLAGDADKGFPELQVIMQVTSYVAPADQGLVGGATEATPAAVPPAATTTPAATTPTATATP